MNNLLYTPFFNATRDVFRLMLDLQEISDKPVEEDAIFNACDRLDIAIGVVGDLKGEVIYHFPKSTTLQMVRIMSGMEIDEIDDFVTSAMSEIANIISGNVMSLISENMFCDILPPKIIEDAQGPETCEITQGMQISTEIGNIDLEIRLESAK